MKKRVTFRREKNTRQGKDASKTMLPHTSSGPLSTDDNMPITITAVRGGCAAKQRGMIQKMKKSHKTTQTLKDLFLGQAKNATLQTLPHHRQQLQQSQPQQHPTQRSSSCTAIGDDDDDGVNNNDGNNNEKKEDDDRIGCSFLNEENDKKQKKKKKSGLMVLIDDDQESDGRDCAQFGNTVDDYQQLHPSYTNATDVPMEIYKDETLYYRIQKEKRQTTFDQPAVAAATVKADVKYCYSPVSSSSSSSSLSSSRFTRDSSCAVLSDDVLVSSNGDHMSTTRCPANTIKRFREKTAVLKREEEEDMSVVNDQQQQTVDQQSTYIAETDVERQQMPPPTNQPFQQRLFQQQRRRRQQQQHMPLRNIKFCNAGQVHQLILQKTKEYNNLRESLLRPVFYDISVVESQKVFAQLSDDIEYLKKIKMELKSSEHVDQFNEETMSMVIHDVLFNNGSLVSSSPFCDVDHINKTFVARRASSDTYDEGEGRRRGKREEEEGGKTMPISLTVKNGAIPGLLPCVKLYQTIEHQRKHTTTEDGVAISSSSSIPVSSSVIAATAIAKKRKCFKDTPIGKGVLIEEEKNTPLIGRGGIFDDDGGADIDGGSSNRKGKKGWNEERTEEGVRKEREGEEDHGAFSTLSSSSLSISSPFTQQTWSNDIDHGSFEHMEVSSEAIFETPIPTIQTSNQQRETTAIKDMTHAMNVYRQMLNEMTDSTYTDQPHVLSWEESTSQVTPMDGVSTTTAPLSSVVTATTNPPPLPALLADVDTTVAITSSSLSSLSLSSSSVMQQQQQQQQPPTIPLSQQQLKLKDVTDKDKKCTIVLSEDAFVEKVHDRRIKHKRACDEHTVINLVAAKIAKHREDEYAHRRLLPRQGDIICKRCGGVCDADTVHACYVCSECGTVDPTTRVSETDIFTNRYMLSTNSTSSFKAIRGSTYKPLGHFTEIMYQLQGKRKSKAPYHVKKVCRDYCIRYGIKRIDITEAIVRRCLKCYRNGSQYYKYAMEIACELRGIPPPYMTETQESILTYLYPCTVHAYKTSKRYLDRKMNRVGRIKELPNNMLGNYVLYKLCELCGFLEFLPYIRLSKNVDNIRENDESWRHVCKQNKWKFYKTKYFG